MFVLNGASRRAARGTRNDHSVIVIAFMMALVFVPVLAMHAAVVTRSDAALSAMTESVTRIAKRFEREPG